jgi:hypothetical protein
VRLARLVFAAAGIWGVLITLPLYLLVDFIGRKSPPAMNHTEFYYGFVDITVAWQFAFLLIAKDPLRFRPMMLPSIFEKISYVLSILLLFTEHQLSVSQSVLAVPDLLWAALFIISFIRTDSNPVKPRLA